MLTRGMKENSDLGLESGLLPVFFFKKKEILRKSLLKVLLEIPVSNDLFLAVDENCM